MTEAERLRQLLKDRDYRIGLLVLEVESKNKRIRELESDINIILFGAW